MDQDMPLRMELGLGPGDFVLDEDPDPLPKKEVKPSHQIFGPCLLWPSSWADQDGTWHEGRPQPRRLCVKWRPSPPPQKGAGEAPGAEPSPQFPAHFSCGQTAGCIKMPLGTEVCLGLGTLC